MTTTFTATNGDTIETRHGGYLVVKDSHHTEWLGPRTVDTLREYFMAERDTELGRWRDPENPDHLVYQSDPYVQGYRRIAVVNERDMTSVHTFSEGAGQGSSDPKALTAQRYFAARPEPKPWHSAEPGEVWVLETELHPEPRAFKVSSREGYATSNFTQVYNGQPLYEFKDGPIIAGHRIWPEGDDDTCKHPETWFSRTLCPPPCNSMHDICEDCGRPADGCPLSPPGTYNAFAKGADDE